MIRSFRDRDTEDVTSRSLITTEPEHRIPMPHPGETLREDVLEPLEMTPYRLAKELRVPLTRLTAILRGERSITADTALRLARYLGTTPQFWLNLQAAYDLEEERLRLGSELELIRERNSAEAPAAA